MPLLPRSSLLALPVLLLAGACGGPDLPPLHIDPVTTVDLAIALGVDEPAVIGVTVDPVTGQRYVLDANAGIFEILADGNATLVRAQDAFPTPDVAPQSAWTDFVALGDGRFAVTARSDGYLLDLVDESMTEYFCYEPGFMDPELEQLTHGVAFDAEASLLYAQPATYDVSGESGPVDEAISSAIGAYSIEGGQPVAWFEIPYTDYLAGGLGVDLDGTLLLGYANELHRFIPEGEGRLEGLGMIEGIGRIDGLTVDPQTGTILVVDGVAGMLVAFDLGD